MRLSLPPPKWKYLIGGITSILIIIAIIMLIRNKKKDKKVRRRKQKNRITLLPIQVNKIQKTTTMSPYRYAYMNPTLMDACYSTRLVVPTYNGPVIKIEKNDGSQQDIYTDATQSFLRTKTGLSLTNWLSAEVGKVRVWYDQSGNENHAFCYNYCPTISILDSNKYVLRFQQYTDNGLRMKKPVKPYSIFFQFWHDNDNSGKIISTDVDSAINQYYGVVIQNGNINGNKDQYNWFYVGKGDKDFTVNQTDSDEYNLSEWNTVCLSIEDPMYSANNNETLNMIGKDISGYISELILYNRPMTSDEIDDYNEHEFDVKK